LRAKLHLDRLHIIAISMIPQFL